MQLTSRHVANIVAAAIILSCSLLFAHPAFAAECPAGTQPATAANLDKMRAAGIPDPKVGMCWNSADKIVGAEAGEAKQYLRSIFNDRGGRCSDKTDAEAKINNLNPTFALCAAKFLKAVREMDPSIKITSAYRTTEHQRCLCGDRGSSGCAAAGNSNHQLGIAVDLTARNYSWLHAQIDRFPGLRYLTIANDPYHMEAVKGGPCMQPGYVPPDFSPTNPPAPPFDNAIRRLFQPTPPPPPVQTASPAATQPTLQQTTPPTLGTNSTTTYDVGTCAPQFYCMNSTYYYRTSTCIDQVYQKCQYGCAETGLCAEGVATSSTPTTTSTSTYDLIDQFANPTSTASSSTPAPITLNPGTAQATVLQPQETENGIVYVPVAPGRSPSGQQTFTSSDLSGGAPTFSQPQSGFQTTLASLKQAVLGMLAYLRPFGGVSQVHYAE